MPERTVAMVGEAFETMIDASDSVHRSATFLERVTRVFARVFIPLVMGIFLVVAGLIVAVKIEANAGKGRDARINKLEGIVSSLQKSSNETRDAATSAKISSESADESLKQALAQSQSSNQNKDVADALKKIDALYTVCVQRKECK